MYREPLLEDGPVTRDRLAGMVDAAPVLALALALADVRSALAGLAAHEPPHVPLADLQLPDGGRSIDGIRRLRQLLPGSEAMVISVFGRHLHRVPGAQHHAEGPDGRNP